MPLIKFIDGCETVAEMESRARHPGGQPRRDAGAATTSTPPSGEDPDFHKQPEYLAAQDNGPWAAFDLSLGGAMYSGFTMGGLTVSIDGEVLRADGSVIPGLYAAGACASQHRPGRQGLRQRHPAGRGLVLRPPRGHARGTPRASQAPRSPSRRVATGPSPSSSQPRVVMLLDGAAVADADHDAVGQSRGAAPRYSANSWPSSSADVDSSRNTTLRLASAAPARTRRAAAHRGTAPSTSRRSRRAGAAR